MTSLGVIVSIVLSLSLLVGNPMVVGDLQCWCRQDWIFKVLSDSLGHIDASITTHENVTCRVTGFYGDPKAP